MQPTKKQRARLVQLITLGVVTPGEVADYLEISGQAVRRWVDAGEAKAARAAYAGSMIDQGLQQAITRKRLREMADRAEIEFRQRAPAGSD